MSEANLDERFAGRTTQAEVDEGNAFKVAPTGGYNVQLEIRDQRVGDDEARPWEYDRAITSFRCPIVVLTEDEREQKIGSAIVDVSHETRRMDSGDLDRLSKRYLQLVKALQEIEALPKGDVDAGDVWEAASSYPVHAFVTESFKDPASGKYVSVERPKDNETIKKYKDLGVVPKNFVQSLSKYRQEA